VSTDDRFTDEELRELLTVTLRKIHADDPEYAEASFAARIEEAITRRNTLKEN